MSMELTKQQKKGTLASINPKVNKKAAIRIRNVLSQKVDYWPILGVDKFREFGELLDEYLRKSKIPEDLKKACKDESYQAMRSHLKIGVNSVIRSLRNKTAKALIISDEINPKFLSRHLMALGLYNNNSLSVIVVPQLKQLMKVGIGVSTITFTIANEEKDESLEDLLKWCSENSDPATFMKEYNIKVLQKAKKSAKVLKNKNLEPVNFESLYLTRESSAFRQFIPKSTEIVSMPEDDFILLGSLPDDFAMDVDHIEFRPNSKKNQKSASEVYHPLIVKRIKGNADRPNQKKQKNSKMNKL